MKNRVETVTAKETKKQGKADQQFAYVDNTPYAIEEGETILQFMRRHFGSDEIPTLCDAPNLKPFGSCRLCSVDIARDSDT